MSLPPLVTPPLTPEDWLTGAIQTLYAGLAGLDDRVDQLSTQLTQTRSDLMATAAELKALVQGIKEKVDHELQQLVDARNTAASLADLQAAVDSAVAELGGIGTKLDADDAPPASPAA